MTKKVLSAECYLSLPSPRLVRAENHAARLAGSWGEQWSLLEHITPLTAIYSVA